MKLSEHTEHIRQLIDKAFRNRLGRMGISNSSVQPIENVAPEYLEDRKRVDIIRPVFISETGNENDAYEKLIEEFTFTLFNRIAALKVMEAHTLHPEIITKRTQHGDRSFSHLLWLEQNPEGRNEDQEGLIRYFLFQLDQLSNDIPLFSPKHPYHLLPTPVELNGIINAFNEVEQDVAVGDDIWQSDDVLGWLYESYNNYKKAAHKESGEKTEFNKVSIQSQVYTPKWVVKFLVDNSLGKTYLEMFPDSEIKRKYKIANVPKTSQRERKPLTEIKLIDPATGSGNFLLYAFDLFYDLYVDQIDNYGANYDSRKIPELIIQNNLHGIDLDDRAIQLAQLGLFIKAKRKKSTARIESFNLVSSDFYLPPYEEVKTIFEANSDFDPKQQEVIRDIWTDLQNAYKFGALIRLEEKLNFHFHGLIQDFQATQIAMFTEETLANFEQFRSNFFINLKKAVTQNSAKQGVTFLNTKTQDAITFLQLLTQKYDVSLANPPYTPSGEYGEELREFVEDNYKEPVNSYENLYGCFIQRCLEFTLDSGYISMITPQTFMFIDSFKNLRGNILNKSHIEILVQYGFGGIFKESVDPCFFILKKTFVNEVSLFLKFDTIFNNSKNELFQEIIDKDLKKDHAPDHIYLLEQNKFLLIKGQPFIFWISEIFRNKFQQGSLDKYLKVCQGLATGDNNRFLRFHWETLNDGAKWIPYAKGGTFNKWFGNLWLTVNWSENGKDIKSFKDDKGKLRSRPQNESFYFQSGITYSASGRGGYAFRFLPSGCIFDVGGSSIFLTAEYKNIYYALGLLNSKLAFYIADCLNPTANIQVGDIQRIPFVKPSIQLETKIESLTKQSIENVKIINQYKIVEPNFETNLFYTFQGNSLKDKIIAFLVFETRLKTEIIINESIIDESILDVYELSNEDCKLIEDKMGSSIATLPVLGLAKSAYLEANFSSNETKMFINNLSETEFDEEKTKLIKDGFNTLYQGKNDLEDFCRHHQVNPISIWYLFKESNILPLARAKEISLEFLIDAFRKLLMEDEDGLIPLVGLPDEQKLIDRLERHCLENGFTSAQFMQLDNLLSCSLNDYIEKHFFKNLCDHINLFSYLPKTPFIWHLTSGKHQGFEVYLIIYKWNKDRLFKLKSHYLAKRKENLEFRVIQLQDSDTAQSQSEKELIRYQLNEINEFDKKIDELIEEGYDPILDGGVAKNIAPLQKKEMLKTDVLNKSQLEKYLKADW